MQRGYQSLDTALLKFRLNKLARVVYKITSTAM